jgi:acyl-coenzyme A thioesterase 13
MPGSDKDTSQVEGNASPEIKLTLLSALHFMKLSHVSQSTDKPFRGFEAEFASRLQLTEVSMLSKTEEPEKFEGRVVIQVTVDKGTFCFSYSLCLFINSQTCLMVLKTCTVDVRP